MSKGKKWLIGIGAFVALDILFRIPTKIFAFLANNVLFEFYYVLVAMDYMYYILAIVAVIYLVRYLRSKGKDQRSSAQRSHQSESLDKLMANFGENQIERSININKAFDEKSKEIYFSIEKKRSVFKSYPYYLSVQIGRSLASMLPRDREVLRSAMLLYNEGANRNLGNSYNQISSIIYGDGKATIYAGWNKSGILANKTINEAIVYFLDEVEPSVSLALSELAEAVAKHPDNSVIQGLAARLLGTGGDLSGQGNLTSATLDARPENFLIIGHAPKAADSLLGFAGEGSLITVAPPGSGKTQCHVIPNLLTWTGPAVVLDIKGEIHAATSAWRAANVGPIFKFSPLDPDQGNSYNPLLAVSDDPDHIWEDSRFLADMLIVPSGKSKDPFWESRARDVLNAAIAITVRNNPPEERTMEPVLDILHGVGWDKFIISLQAATDVPSMTRSGKSLGEMEPKMRDSVLQTALASMSTWAGARIARATKKSDWTPADLRSGKNPTIYICIKPNEIDSYASMLRVIIAQHIRTLTSNLPERGGAPILFILDELPRLRHMPPVEEALEIGRQYGIKLWMFTQSLGQLETAYENADGMVANCAVRCFMNPSLQDGTAQKLSDDMGYRESVVDGTRVKRVEPDVLAGPEFTNKVIVMASGATPATVEKHFAHNDPELTSRVNLGSESSAAE